MRTVSTGRGKYANSANSVEQSSDWYGLRAVALSIHRDLGVGRVVTERDATTIALLGAVPGGGRPQQTSCRSPWTWSTRQPLRAQR